MDSGSAEESVGRFGKDSDAYIVECRGVGKGDHLLADIFSG